MSHVDPITTQVIAKNLFGVAEEMSGTLIRAAFSPNIKERADCSTAIFDKTGLVIALAHRVPIHLGSVLGSVDEILRRHADNPPQPGDMFIANDPYTGGGSHLPDISVIAPVFIRERLVAYVANIAHHADVGGMVPGSESTGCKSIFQEGIRIPPVRIRRGGKTDRDILDMILLNTRTPDERLGDLNAQFASNITGIRGIEHLYERHGEVTEAAMDSYLEHTERRFRAAINCLPEGEYEAGDYLDPEPESDDPIPLRLKMKTKEGRLFFDFTGTARQLPSARNVPEKALMATIYTVAKSLLDPGIPGNAGYFRAIAVEAPIGSIVNPQPGAAVGTRSLTCAVIGDLVASVLSQALPERGLAGSGPHQQYLIAGYDPRKDRLFIDYETVAGALGARPYCNGLDAVRIHASGASNLPIEALEHEYPLRIERYCLREGSGGEGEYRGGDGVIREYRILGRDVTVSLSSERQIVVARGRNGGKDGSPGRFILNPGTTEEAALPSMVMDLSLPTGSVLGIYTPGGGGYGER